MDISTVDITELFWPLIKCILTLDYDELKKTREFEEIFSYIDNDDTFLLSFGDSSFVFDNVNDLFYGMASYYEDKEMFHEAEILANVIKKMEFIVTMNDMTDMWSKVSF